VKEKIRIDECVNIHKAIENMHYIQKVKITGY